MVKTHLRNGIEWTLIVHSLSTWVCIPNSLVIIVGWARSFGPQNTGITGIMLQKYRWVS